MRAFLFSVFLFLFIAVNSLAQISQGGFPKEITDLKSSEVTYVEMPALNNLLIDEKVNIASSPEIQLKPFKFAHAFSVSLNTNNSGEWFFGEDGLKIWQLKIRSKGAKSINLIFDNFMLPQGARLFIFNENKSKVLGAFTSENNKSSGKFAVSPIAGDEITIQYEISDEDLNQEYFEIASINHDYIGILDVNERRPLGKAAGTCNVDVNCDLGEDWNEVKNSVCRLIVNGIEICSGALINNTAENEKPYILSAAHCYDKWDYAETTVYVFNYESPYCEPLDGDPSNSVSGALMKAQFDSMDFALVELSVIPPPEFRPYYAGWERSVVVPDSSVSIHHPQGDIKKIALDADSPEISDFTSRYTNNGFLKVLRWDEGVTEVGSSGGPLFNMDKNIIGTLTGGLATCSNPIDDYFERFSMSWDFKLDSARQLKYWLDPLGSDIQSLDGNQFYEGEEICDAFTNLNDEDSHENIQLTVSDEFSGYWGGTNSVGITEFVEQFSIYGNEQLSGISLGIGKIVEEESDSQSQITIKVYDGSKLPETLIYSENIFIKDLDEGVMNFIGFNEIVEPNDTFFVGFELSSLSALDSFVVYQSLRPANTQNFFYFKQDGIWQSFKDASMGYNSIVNVFELVACNVDDTVSDTPVVDDSIDILVFPNPTQSEFSIVSGFEILEEDISILNLIGQTVEFKVSIMHNREVAINIAGNIPGVYFVRFNTKEGYRTRKISYVPW